MAKDTKNEPRAEAATTVGRGGLELAIRERARMLIDAIVEEELEHALGAAPSVEILQMVQWAKDMQMFGHCHLQEAQSWEEGSLFQIPIPTSADMT